ncbi:MAG: UvrD-helicase domain-containing protein [Planctomycetota bacterium]|nr:UvrD-helicase domain-containing protein [Planctomycetota bacterium]
MSPLTADQQKAAFAAVDGHLAVVAGAGTGKTHVLVERYLHLVLDHKVEIPRILAVTFTEKAAREMKTRVREELHKRGQTSLARTAEFAPISTVHSFLGLILRERALDAGLDPRFVVSDEMTAQLLLEEALQQTVDALEPGLRATLVGLQGGEETLRELYLAARATPLEMRELRPVEPDARLAERMAGFLEACAGQRAKAKTGERLLELARLRGQLQALDPSLTAVFRDLVKGTVATAQRDLFKEGKEIAKEYALLEHAEAARAVGEAVVEVLDRLDRRYTELKRADGLVDFSDLEREGLKLLRSDAGPKIAAEYDHLLVDEYQDTSRIQQAILDLLAQSCRRFGVGDEKQSIYRFRYADVDVFRELQGASAVQLLGGSFRSRPELLSFNNAFFRRLFEGRNVEPQDLHPEAGWRDRAEPCVEVIAPQAKDAAAGRRLEARALAQRLKRIVEGKQLTLSRVDKQAEPLTYKHCAVLLRAMTHLTVYERALAEAGVPYVVIQGRGYYAAREVVDLAHLLLLLADPYDGYKAVGSMTSLMCGVPEGDLLQLQAEGPLPLRALRMERPEAVPQDRWDKLRTFATRFERWRELMGRMSTGDLVETILRETRFPELMLLQEPDGRRRHANLMKALRRSRKHEEEPVQYARALLEFRERELRESEAPIASETDEAVKIMTIHAAKGLEFPLVAVADLSAQRNGTNPVILHPKGLFGFKLRAEPKPLDPPGMPALQEWDKQQDKNEKYRLYYVAFTRAQEHLLLTGARYKGASRKILEPLIEAPPPEVRVLDDAELLRAAEVRGPGPSVRGALRRRADLPAGIERDDAGALKLLERIAAIDVPEPDATPYVAGAADLVEFARCPRRYRLARMLRLDLDAAGPAEYFDFNRPTPAEPVERSRRRLGTALHEALAEIEPGGVPSEEALRRHLPGASAKELEQLSGWCSWLAQTPLIQQIGGRPVEKEMPFFAKVGGIPVRGVIDLYAPDPALLVDYKTSRSADAEPYEVQIAIYLEALRALGLKVPATGHLVFVDAQEVVEVEPRPLEELVEQFREAHRGAGSYPPQPGKTCDFCDFRDVCLADGVPVPGAGRRPPRQGRLPGLE